MFHESARKGIQEYKKMRKRHNDRRKTLGFEPLNQWHEGYEIHHIDNKNVIYIPKNLHVKIRHGLHNIKGWERINLVAWDILESEVL
jgi:hypothetical protein